jgi:serine/threonine-protein kinase
MGVVLLAIREAADFEQTVALKIIRGRFVDPLLARRFQEERRILAGLEHPGVARLIDGGVTEDGQPYYAMEYVDGEDLLTWCNRRRLGIRERARLFVSVCEAVHAAHYQMVVHRDLKPSNILVTAEGQPKLLDFGIAKSLEADPGGKTELWVTPAYASPEQVTGAPVTIATDVYALGVLLCELLSGFRPYRTTDLPTPLLGRVIAETPPRRPSELAERGLPDEDMPPAEAESGLTESAAARGLAPRHLARALRGDLDVIVLTALAKEPDRRYGSARRLGEDLNRYLEGLPIEARPATVRYRLGKFLGRHRAASLGAGLLVVALGAGTAATVWQAREAERARDAAEVEAERARQVTALMTDIFRLGDPTRNVGDTIGVRQVLAEGARRVQEGLDDDPPVQATLFLELARVYRNLGILDEAVTLGDRALEIRQELEPAGSAHADALAFRALLAREAGEPGAQALLERAVAVRGEAVTPADSTTADLLTALGWEVRSHQEYDRAASLFEEAMAIRRAGGRGQGEAMANAMLGLASTYHDRGSFDQAEALFLEALEQGAGDRPDPVAASAMANLGMIRRLREQYAEAAPMVRGGREMRAALYDAAHPDRIQSDEEWGVTLVALGRYREAEPLLMDALDRSIRVLGEDHIRTRNVRGAVAGLDWTMGRYELALARTDSVLAAKWRAHGGDHPGIVLSLVNAGQILLEAGRPREAQARLEEAMAMGERLGGTEGVYGSLIRAQSGMVALDRGETAVADSLLELAFTLARENLREDHRYVLEIQRMRAQVRLARGDAPGALALLGPVALAEARVRPDPHPRRGETELLRGTALLELGDGDGARRSFREADRQFAELPPAHPFRVRVREGLADAG